MSFKVQQITNELGSNSKKIANIEFDQQQINEIKEGFNVLIDKESKVVNSSEIATDDVDSKQLQRYKSCSEKLKSGLNQLNYNDLADITLAMNEKIGQVERTQGIRATELILKLKDLRKIKEQLR